MLSVFITDMPPDIADKTPERQLIIKMAGYLEKKGRMVSIVDSIIHMRCLIIILYASINQPLNNYILSVYRNS